MNNRMGKRWDIFCKIVDNYGDIGVCWRLSQQLAKEHQLQIRLFIDDLTIASHIITNLNATKQQQTINGIEICNWDESTDACADVVIETFGCNLPEPYVQQMQPNKTIWINLEYLSAESWVSDFHAKPSPHPTLPLTKHFFFPGFIDATGGLIREKDLITQRDEFLNSTALQTKFLQKLWSTDKTNASSDTIKISIFCYPQAQIECLVEALQNTEQHISLYLPFNSTLSTFNVFLTDFELKVGDVIHKNNLTVHILPFLSQDDYDSLLWTCDMNFVRGEDSWIRAIWAGKPFVWQPYIQAEDTHINKLNAFLDVYTNEASPEVKTLLYQSSLAWSGQAEKQVHIQDNISKPEIWQHLITQLPALHAYAKQRADAFISQPDMATKLVIFSENLTRNQV
ncbi:MAG TPA: elongation factor P maturation arginine rhamnosyltransferase EarP [Methylotenera sp.]|nr:elongation factor P maturation arginine rhamnosyltransferase EarP [Methylotenera sp.]